MRRFVGFGFGPIQAGLMLYEAQASGGFDDYVIAEVDARLVAAVRAAGGTVTVNVAGADGIRRHRLPGIRIGNPADEDDRAMIVAAIRDADEMATAIPSVTLYGAGGRSSIAALLAEGVEPGRPRILYASENNNYAAELLHAELVKLAPADRFRDLALLDTVIGKMSGVIATPAEMRALGLEALVPGGERCVLVEEFNRILVSRVRLPAFPSFVRAIRVFVEKDDLLPFEEAKLFGHNAIHALLGYLAERRGLSAMSDIRRHPDLLDLGRRAFLEESGAALVAKHAVTGDPLFTREGWRVYAEELLVRMTNPWLADRVERIIRDPRRKLAWADRFFGTMRVALAQGVTPRTLALGAAAAAGYALRADAPPGAPAPSPEAVRRFLLDLWNDEPDDGTRERCLALVARGLEDLSR
jgi:mannitol-1-phosphate 5-dehydrogenase